MLRKLAVICVCIYFANGIKQTIIDDNFIMFLYVIMWLLSLDNNHRLVMQIIQFGVVPHFVNRMSNSLLQKYNLILNLSWSTFEGGVTIHDSF